MKISAVKKVVGNTPYMNTDQAQVLTDIILEKKYTNLLELGFKHGVSSVYLAAALDEMQTGMLTTIDLESAKSNQPNLDFFVSELGLGKYINPIYEETSYNWRLMKFLLQSPVPKFDFCYLDGAHDWYVDGFAFELVDKLLAPGGVIVFDDLDWKYKDSMALAKTERVKTMPKEEVETPQVRLVYELLVKTNKNYSNFYEKDNWAFAYKNSDAEDTSNSNGIQTEIVYKEVGVGAYLDKLTKKIRQKIRTTSLS